MKMRVRRNPGGRCVRGRCVLAVEKKGIFCTLGVVCVSSFISFAVILFLVFLFFFFYRTASRRRGDGRMELVINGCLLVRFLIAFLVVI